MHINTRQLAERVFARQRSLHPLDHYAGILSLQGLARMACVPDAPPTALALVRSELLPFIQGRHQVRGNFVIYNAGGNGAALLWLKGKLPEAAETLQRHAAEQMAAPRGEDGVYCRPRPPQLAEQRIWIDTAFAVCPSLLACGLAADKPAWVDDAVHQIRAMYRLFLDADTGLVHQGRNFNGPGSISQDHWSRGNGWGLLALAEVVDLLPAGHPQRAACVAELQDWLRAALRYQNGEGLWFQEMCVESPWMTYTETSGSGLILYALGKAIEHGLLGDCLEAWLRGTRSLLRYVTSAGDVFNCCTSCCCPGDGSVAAYLQRPPIRNDHHAFGPVILALHQAQVLGYAELTPLPEAEARLG